MNEQLELDFDYQDMVATLAKDGDLILKELTPHQVHLWHMATGVAGEAGELLDAIKKHVIYQKQLDVENVIEELGDLEFYMEAVRQIINVSREDVLEANKQKLGKRYKGYKYTDQQAQDRADKGGVE